VAPSDRFSINTRKIAHETIDNEVVIVNFESGNYYSLNGVGADIWGLIEKNAGLREIVEDLEGRYEENGDRLNEAVTQLMTELNREELIVRNPDKDGETCKDISKRPAPDRNETRLPFTRPVLEKYTDMSDMLLLDPIHDVDEIGWPAPRREGK